MNIHQSTTAYEAWLRDQIGSGLVKDDLEKKHEKMVHDPFSFLRATYWRWAETILADCPELADLPQVLAIGDVHLENFGTWRDLEGRLIWGVNDFDEAATMPYALDLVRLACSAILAVKTAGKDDELGGKRICTLILDGYRDGLCQPEPVVLDRDNAWLRKALALSNDQRRHFWEKLDGLATQQPSPRFRKALIDALPDSHHDVAFKASHRGTGSLGRPRLVAHAEWLGGPVVREAKAIVSSAWNRTHRPSDTTLHLNRIARGRARAPDPHYKEASGILVRRLSPSSRKIEAKHDLDLLLRARMLRLMGREVANCHADNPRLAEKARLHAEGQTPGWLHDCAKSALKRIADDHAEFGA
ncbi:DUF2252 domain-containing protein [Phreatobacter aquaticus]|uniref:DUF2252 domain-containing protein n=1 Tax=Phreatobacter aquaticus TaxID=2570229 RepID=A0A4D7QL34_9HYPH|nr:DUF2252 domain-containing protein [Phreatobacter aquaticus]